MDKTTLYCEDDLYINVWIKLNCINDCFIYQTGKSKDYILRNYKVYIGKRKLKLLSYIVYFDDGTTFENDYPQSVKNIIPESKGEDIYNFISKNYYCN